MGKKKLTEGVHLGIFASLVYGDDVDLEDALKWKRYQIMKEFGWTYQEYCNTPERIVTEIYALMRTENKATNQQMKDQK